MTRPLLFLDVDGTLLPFGGDRLPLMTDADWVAWQRPTNPRLSAVVRAHGPRLLGLRCELVWATAWRDDANLVIAPLLGLPELPVAELPPWSDEFDTVVPHWKTGPLVAMAAGRPFVWVDDEITDADRDWVAAHHPGPALLHRVDPDSGLTEADFAALGKWLDSLESGGRN